MGKNYETPCAGITKLYRAGSERYIRRDHDGILGVEKGSNSVAESQDELEPESQDLF